MKDILELIDAYLDGHLSEEGEKRLTALLEADPGNVRIFVRETHMHSAIRRTLFAQERLTRAMPQDERAQGTPAPTQRAPARRKLAFALTAAVAVVALVLVILAGSPGPPVSPTVAPKVTPRDWLEGVILPEDDRERLLLLGRLAGVEKFSLTWIRSTGRVEFLAPDVKEYFCGSAEPDVSGRRFQRLLAFTFPKAKKVACQVNKAGIVKDFIVLR